MTKYKLGDLCRIASSKRIFESEYVDQGIPFIRGQEISDGSILDPKASFECYISQSRYEEIKEKYGKPTKGDILITAVGTIGNLCYLDKDIDFYFKDGNVIWFSEIISSCEGKFLFHFMKSSFFKDQLKYFMIGAVQKALTIDMLKKVEVPLPPLSEQKKIASVLSALDDKIALNKKMNQKLEAMAKRLYDYWFVQFDFPDKNGRPYKTTGGPMTYNPTLKREIPEGWDVAPISEFIEKNFNGEWGKEEASEDDIRVHCVRGADIVDMVDMPVRYISTKKKDRILNPNDIIVEISGGSPTQSTGRATFVTRNTLNRFDSPMTCSNFCQIIRLKDAKCASYFFEMWQKFYASDIFFNFEGKTSGIKNFQTDSFIATPWAHPPKELMYKFDEMYQSFMKKKERLIAENQKLTALRDKLLPLLMNGQVVVG